jgi:hypothetical protein
LKCIFGQMDLVVVLRYTQSFRNWLVVTIVTTVSITL